MAITLGFQPERLVVKLSRFGDLVSGLEYAVPGDPGAGWPIDAVIALRFYATPESEVVGEEHVADIVAGEDDEGNPVARKLALWDIPKAECKALLDAGLETARLFYATPGRELEWAVGATKDTR